jgi:hypothetical protein
MELNEMLEYARSRSAEHANLRARELRAEFEEATLKLLGLPSDRCETPEAEELRKATSRLAREIAVLSPDCVEALKAKTSTALYWAGPDNSEPWRDLASPYLDTLTTQDMLLSFGEVFATDYKRRLAATHAKNDVKLREAHLACCDSDKKS